MIAWMKGQYIRPQSRTVKMDINLRGGNGFMAKHLLDGAEIGPTLKQMGRK